MRQDPRRIYANLVSLMGGSDSVAAHFGVDASTISRRHNVRGGGDMITEAFEMEDATGVYLLTMERLRDICRDARDQADATGDPALSDLANTALGNLRALTQRLSKTEE